MRFNRLGLILASGFLAAGLAVVASGCSDPVPPTPQGGFQVQFVQVGNGCSVGGHASKVGDVNATERNTVVVDSGPEGASVNCSVTGAGPFAVSGQIQQDGNSLQIQIASLPASATKASPAHGQVGFTSPTTVKTYVSDQMQPCDFYFVAGSKETVASGKVWVAFVCGAVSASGTGTDDICSLQESYVLLENCAES